MCDGALLPPLVLPLLLLLFWGLDPGTGGAGRGGGPGSRRLPGGSAAAGSPDACAAPLAPEVLRAAGLETFPGWRGARAEAPAGTECPALDPVRGGRPEGGRAAGRAGPAALTRLLSPRSCRRRGGRRGGGTAAAGAPRRRAPAAAARGPRASKAPAPPRAPSRPASPARRARPAAAPAGLRARPVPAASPRPAFPVPGLRGGGGRRGGAPRTPRRAVLLLGPRARPPRFPRLAQRLRRRRRPGWPHPAWAGAGANPATQQLSGPTQRTRAPGQAQMVLDTQPLHRGPDTWAALQGSNRPRERHGALLRKPETLTV
ncbi:translation initiation factor IF-2-like [Panthera uncia]|uniref:translation initiation factor IF-2-like n=1 Tax=Panthera uncia TaxID=29064 RepID=UPI0020FFD7DA|nr:translation initiation factor IF-2-like [Panthera uncia]